MSKIFRIGKIFRHSVEISCLFKRKRSKVIIFKKNFLIQGYFRIFAKIKMLTNKDKSAPVHLITLGCSKNIVDSEVLANQLTSQDVNVFFTPNFNKNSTVIVNTCGFIESAKEESIQTILNYVDLKNKGKIKKIMVTGCLSQRYKNELSQEIPEVDRWFGNMELPLILQEFNLDYKKNLLDQRFLSTPKHYAYLKISEGCNRTCSFCAIPLMRGKHQSKPMENILFEAENLVNQGVKEIMLIAQELTYYGLDIYHKRMLPQLLEKLAQIKGLEWIRLHYSYPHQFPLDIISVMRDHKNICNYLDLPLQHINNRILKSMKRQLTKIEIMNLIEKIYKIIPNINIRTTFIVGYPSETKSEFKELIDFVQQQKFSRLGVFTYSHEENTSAFNLKNDIETKIKNERLEELMAIQQEISYQQNLKKIHSIQKVLIDKKEAGVYLGRTEADSVEVDNEVIVKSNQALKVGHFYNVKITKAYDYDLEGEIIN